MKEKKFHSPLFIRGFKPQMGAKMRYPPGRQYPKGTTSESGEAMILFLSSVLTIAGSDSSGGAGIQADLKTITALGLYGTRLKNPNTHGAGCTLSSAITCGLAKGMNFEESILTAKGYLNGALNAGLNIGKGNGPLWHGWRADK